MKTFKITKKDSGLSFKMNVLEMNAFFAHVNSKDYKVLNLRRLRRRVLRVIAVGLALSFITCLAQIILIYG